MITQHNWCIPMGRTKMRQILARELYGDGVGDLRAKLLAMMEKTGVALDVDNLDNLGVSIYLHEYYGGKYLPRIDDKPKVEESTRWLTM